MSRRLIDGEWGPKSRPLGPRRFINEFNISAAAHPDGRVAVLLSRYPNLSEYEFIEVLNFVRRARPRDLRRLRSTPTVRAQLDRFLLDQGTLLTTQRERLVWTMAAILLLSLLCWMLWDTRPQPLSASSLTKIHRGAIGREGMLMLSQVSGRLS